MVLGVHVYKYTCACNENRFEDCETCLTPDFSCHVNDTLNFHTSVHLHQKGQEKGKEDLTAPMKLSQLTSMSAESTCAALTEYHRLGGLITTKVYFTSGGWEVQDKGPGRFSIW